MLPVVKVWCLPKMGQKRIKELFNKIVAKLVQTRGIDVHDETDVLVLFPSDKMLYGLGTEIFVEVDQLLGAADSKELRQLIAMELTMVVRSMFPGAHVCCAVREFNREDGYWDSPE